MNEVYYPPAGFHFEVRLLGAATALSMLTSVDASFQEVSGIRVEMGVEEVVEGGENRFVHRLPKQSKYTNLVLKRGVVTQASTLAEWVSMSLGSRLLVPIQTQGLLVTLLNDTGMPLVVWGFVNAFPVRWETADLNSMESKILTETMEFSYNYFERVTLNASSMAVAAAKLARFAASLR